jgi:hypothetical protein
MRIDLSRARELAEKEPEPHRRPDLDLIFLDDMKVDVPEGWVFFWDDLAKKFLQGFGQE